MQKEFSSSGCEGDCVISVLETGILGLREVKSPAQGHTASTWQGGSPTQIPRCGTNSLIARPPSAAPRRPALWGTSPGKQRLPPRRLASGPGPARAQWRRSVQGCRGTVPCRDGPDGCRPLPARGEAANPALLTSHFLLSGHKRGHFPSQNLAPSNRPCKWPISSAVHVHVQQEK